MKKPFLAKRIPFFGSMAMLVLCLVFFLIPFFARSARFALDDVRNDVSDWLPEHFQETKQLTEFRDYFLGEQFVLISWPGCNEDDRNFHSLVEMLRRESLAHSKAVTADEKLAQQLGDEHGWHYADSFYENAGSQRERWFRGRGAKWYYIQEDGKVFRWLGENDLLRGVMRFFERQLTGSYKVQGEHIVTLGSPKDNEFYKDPRKLFARFFKDVQTGPDFLEQLAGEDGSLNLTSTSAESRRRLQARIEAHQRLTGAFFAPTPSPGFDWTPDAMRAELSEQRLLLLPAGWEEELEFHVQELIATRHGGKESDFRQANADQQLEYWLLWWDRLGVSPPPRQTCIMVTLNGPVIDDFSVVVGRGLLGKPRGRILELATGECGISPANLHLGGPPVDNVAIDEEGSITLLRLASLSGIIGIALSLLSFRSLRVTLMLFFVGGVAAISSLGIVWMLGGSLDAILMSMPSLVYVLAISGAIHMVNYYRDACHESGRRFAVGEAVRHALFPCSVAAFTTAIGLLSLCTSNLAPINKFGFFSAIAVVGTLALLFTYLPAALEVFPPNFARRQKKRTSSWFMDAIDRFWLGVGRLVTRYHWGVNALMITLMVVIGLGISQVQTSVQLLKLFHDDAKILHDYRWFEENLGKLVPMEILVRFQDQAVEPFEPQRAAGEKTPAAATAARTVAYHQSVPNSSSQPPPSVDPGAANIDSSFYQYTLRDRLELVRLLRRNLETVFGAKGQDIIGSGMSIDVFTPNVDNAAFDMVLERDFDRLPRDFLYSPRQLPRPGQTQALGDNELWRISLRLGAFSDVDYGRFVNEIKQVVEPSMRAAEFRNQLLQELRAAYQFGSDYEKQFNILFIANNFSEGDVSLPARDPESLEDPHDPTLGSAANQSAIFAQTVRMLLHSKGIEVGGVPGPEATRRQYWVSGQRLAERDYFQDPAKLNGLLDRFGMVVIVDEHPELDKTAIQQRSDLVLLDVSQLYQYRIDPVTKAPLPGQLTAEQRMKAEQEGDAPAATPWGRSVDVSAVYTGVIPIVYKAQRTLLKSLFESIFLSFLMIAVVMSILLRPWRSPTRLNNLVNARGGLLSMLPNTFPIVIVFGMMGHLAPYGVKVDIGSMMTASVAMGIAVDDTIHFLNWYRFALAKGMSRKEAIMEAYARCAKAMTQTTLIAGLGLFAFAFSTFTPTQRFGTLMLILLVVALIGDLVFLPALLSSPLGKYFGKEMTAAERAALPDAQRKPGAVRHSDPDQVLPALGQGPVANPAHGPHLRSIRSAVDSPQ